MKFRLKNLKVDRVDLVERGANPGAHIRLYKADQTKTEGGQRFPAGDYAYVPDPQSPSTWKLRLTSEPGGSPDSGVVGAAVAALGPSGYRGNKVQIPSGDLPGVKSKVLSAWLKANPEKTKADAPAQLTKGEEMPAEELTTTDASPEAEVTVSGAEVVKEAPPVVETVSKADYESVAKGLEEAKEQIAKMKRDQLVSQFVTKGAEYENLGPAPEIGALLLAAYEAFTEEQYQALEKLMKSANEKSAADTLFKTIGDPSAEAASSFEDKIQALAKSRVESGQAKTIELAKMQVMRENPDLRREYAESWR